MKHNDILGKLDPLRKVALVTSGLADDGLKQAGVPAVGRVFLDDLAREKGVSYASAARSFDPALIGRMTKELAGEAAASGARLFVSPDLKTAANPYVPGLSEDAGLNGLIGGAIAGAVHEAGMAVGLSRLSLDEKDVAYLDRREDTVAVHDLFVKPFLKAAQISPCDAVMLTPNRIGSGYPDTNRTLFSDVLGGYLGDTFAIGDGVAANSASLSLLRGKVSLGGAALPLERAARRYVQLKKYRDEGSISQHDLEDAIRDGSALDEAKLNEAADEVADFALRLSSLVPAEIAAGDTARKALAAASIVLLKNNRILPLEKGTNVAVVGEAYNDLTALEGKFKVKGRARGYDRGTERSDPLIPEAVRTAGAADVVLVFLWPDMTGRHLSMPANRIALLRALKKTGKKLVGIVCGDMPADLSFDGVLDALLLAPADNPYAAEALARVLAGDTDPAGRLTRTAYDGGDAYFRALLGARDEGRVRVGGFVGYLRYDTAHEEVRYPFGFGLSYTKFSYSGLSIQGNKVSFTVKNTGSRPGYEVAQIYVGTPTDAVFAPAKRLKAVYKFALKPGESKRATVTLTTDDFATYDLLTMSDDVEAGTYRIYVCSNASTVKLQGKRTLEGVTREPSGVEPADYFPDTYVRDESQNLENRVGTKEKDNVPAPLRHVRRAALFVFPIAAVLFFLLLTVFVFTYALDYSLFFTFDEDAVKWGIYGIAVLMLALIPLLGSFNRRRLAHVRTGALIVCLPLLVACLILGILLMTEKDVEDERLVMTIVSCLAVGAPIMAATAAITEHVLVKAKAGGNRWQKYYFAQEREETMLPEAEFEDAFRVAAEKQEKEPIEEAAPEEPMQFFDKDLTFAELLRDGSLYVKERGFDADEKTMKSAFAALTATQLLIVPEGMGAALLGAVAEYFGKKPYIDNAEQYAQNDDLFTQWKQTERVFKQTQLTAALDDAAQDNAFLHIAILRHAEATRLGQTLGTFAETLSRKRAAVPLPGGEERIIPPNLRVVVEVGAGDLGKIPPAILEAAAVLLPRCNECPPADPKSVVQSVGFDRFAAMKRAVRDDYPLGEDAWKTVDQLDERCRSAHVGNLVWVKTELHAAVLSACGESDEHAIDGALACELLPWMFEVWNNDLCGEKLTDTLAEIFGKNTELCKEFLDARGDGTIKR